MRSTSTKPKQGLTRSAMLWCRWFNQLCPTLKREPFSQQEDLLVVQVSRPQAPWPCILQHWPRIAPAVNPSTLGSHLKHTWQSSDGCSYPGMANAKHRSWVRDILLTCMSHRACRHTRGMATSGPSSQSSRDSRAGEPAHFEACIVLNTAYLHLGGTLP